MGKLFLMGLWTLMLFSLSIIPELIMWKIWGWIGPENFLEKAITLALFGVFGLGVSIATKSGCFILWIHTIDA